MRISLADPGPTTTEGILTGVSDNSSENAPDNAGGRRRKLGPVWPELIETATGPIRISASPEEPRWVASHASLYDIDWRKRFPRMQRRARLSGTGLPSVVVTRRGISLWYPSRILRVRSDNVEWRWRRTGFTRHRITSLDGRVIVEYSKRSKLDMQLAADLTPTEAIIAVACMMSGIDWVWTTNTLELAFVLLLDGI